MWEGHACVGVGFLHVFPKKRQVVVDGAHEFEVDQRLVKGALPSARQDREPSRESRLHRLERREVVRNAKAAVLVSMQLTSISERWNPRP